MKCHVLSCDAASRPVPQSFNSGSDSAGKHPVSTPCRSLSVAPSTRTPPLTESLPRFPPGHPRIAVRPRSKSGCRWRRRDGGCRGFRSPGHHLPPPEPWQRAAGGGPRTCHEMSCSVMRCHVFPPPRPSPTASPKRRMSPSCMSSLHRVSLRSRRRRLACGATLFRAYRMGARARVLAPARFARLIARANRAQGARLPFVPLGFFRAGTRRETKRPPDAASSCPILPQICRSQTNLGIISKLMRYPINWERDKRYANTVAPAPGAGAQSSLMPRLRETGPRIAADAASGATRGVSQASVQNDRTLLQWVVTSQAKPEPPQPVSSCFGLENFGFDIGPEARYRGEAAESGFAC